MIVASSSLRHNVRAAALHPRTGRGPLLRLEVHVTPPRLGDLAQPSRGQDGEPNKGRQQIVAGDQLAVDRRQVLPRHRRAGLVLGLHLSGPRQVGLQTAAPSGGMLAAAPSAPLGEGPHLLDAAPHPDRRAGLGGPDRGSPRPPARCRTPAGRGAIPAPRTRGDPRWPATLGLSIRAFTRVCRAISRARARPRCWSAPQP